VKSRPGCAIVTGGSRGIGNAIARRLARDGLHVVLIARDTEKLKTECEAIIADNGLASYISVDFLSPNFLEIVAEHLAKNELSPNVLINGLGGGFGSKSFDSIDVYSKVMHLNFYVPHELMNLVIQNAKKLNWGRIIYIGTLAINHKSASAPYVAAKAALMAYMKVMAKELAKVNDNFIACAVSPGAINVKGKFLNNLADNEPEKLTEFLEKNSVAAGRLGEPEEVAEVVSFLCDPETTYLNGCNIEIDGGASN
jgi:NAD(P)-dependent dehydrogenase (short-subunit alcohol dehydrogenase family)